MSDKIASLHADVLNALDEMQQSSAYAVRRGVLAEAEQIIVQQERELQSCKDRIAELERERDAAVAVLERQAIRRAGMKPL